MTTTKVDYFSFSSTSASEGYSHRHLETNAKINSKLLLGQFPHGPTISNKDQVFDQIDQALQVRKPPDIEVILVDHLTCTQNAVTRFLHLHLFRFGHICIRYRTSDGQTHLMNVLGNFTEPDATMVNFVEGGATDYLYSTNPHRAQQGGVYNRPMVGLRIENVAPGATDALHAYYQAVAKASEIAACGPRTKEKRRKTKQKGLLFGLGRNSRGGAAGGDISSGNILTTTTTTLSSSLENPMAPGSTQRGAARFQLVEVQLSRLARLLPKPVDHMVWCMADWLRAQDDNRREAIDRNRNSNNNNYDHRMVVNPTRNEGGHKIIDQVEADMPDRSNTTVPAKFWQRVLSKNEELVNHISSLEDIRGAVYHSGNCAQWTSSGLDFCGLLRRARQFPKAILIELLEDEYFRHPCNVHMVYYDQVSLGAPPLYPGYHCLKSAMVHPLKAIRNRYYLNLKPFCHVVVRVPTGSDWAVVQRQQPTRVPQQWLTWLTVCTTYIPAAILLGLVQHIGPLGPTGAAMWLFANWWLY